MLLFGLAALSSTAAAQEIPIPIPKPSVENEAVAPSQLDASPAPKSEAATSEEASPQEIEKDETEASNPPPTADEITTCANQLSARGAVFERGKPIRDSGECGIDTPFILRALGSDIRLDQPATLTCSAALQLTAWVQDSILPNLKLAMPDKKLDYISNSSSYVCRKRNHASKGKISEHAKGNAFDISAFTFTDGSKLIMKPRSEDGTMEGAFQRTITASACLFFSTVLSPGSDASHQDHLHLDVMQRKNDYRYCR